MKGREIDGVDAKIHREVETFAVAVGIGAIRSRTQPEAL